MAAPAAVQGGVLEEERHETPVFPAAGLFAFVLAVAGCSMMPGSDAGWTKLIDGTKGLENWEPDRRANWRAEDGAVAADRGRAAIWSRRTRTRISRSAPSSGPTNDEQRHLPSRADPNKIGADTAYEVNIYDQRPDPSYGTGAIVNVAKVDPMPRPAASGTPTRSPRKGSNLIVVLNGQKTVDVNDASRARPFALQSARRRTAGGAIKFRKVEIKPL